MIKSMNDEINEAVDIRTDHIEPPTEKRSILSLLQKRYPPNEYALMKEVRDAAGYGASRSADFIAVNLWPSRGLAINGIELKSFRSDWLSELKKPQKAESIFQYCDYFWLLTSDEAIAKIEEIPSKWGWLSVKGERIVVKKEAPNLQPLPLTRNFVCAMLKRAVDKTDFVHISDIQDRIDEARSSVTTKRDYELERIKKERDEFAKAINDFRESSGVDLNYRWDNRNPKKLGEALRFINEGGSIKIKTDLLDLEKTAKNVLKKISEALNTIEDVSNPHATP